MGPPAPVPRLRVLPVSTYSKSSQASRVGCIAGNEKAATFLLSPLTLQAYSMEHELSMLPSSAHTQQPGYPVWCGVARFAYAQFCAPL